MTAQQLYNTAHHHINHYSHIHTTSSSDLMSWLHHLVNTSIKFLSIHLLELPFIPIDWRPQTWLYQYVEVYMTRMPSDILNLRFRLKLLSYGVHTQYRIDSPCSSASSHEGDPHVKDTKSHLSTHNGLMFPLCHEDRGFSQEQLILPHCHVFFIMTNNQLCGFMSQSTNHKMTLNYHDVIKTCVLIWWYVMVSLQRVKIREMARWYTRTRQVCTQSLNRWGQW